MKHKSTSNPSQQHREVIHQNFGLSKVAFDEMLEEMKSGNDRLFEQIFLAQFEETLKYLMRRYKVSHAIAYDATMDAMLKFRMRLLEGKIEYNNMRFLFTQIAGQFLMTTLKNDAKSVGLSNENEISDIPEKIDDMILDCLDVAWKFLGDQCSTLLKNYYYKKISLKDLAEQIGKSDVALRKQKQRCLETLRNYFLKQYKR